MTEYNIIRKLLYRMEEVEATRLIVSSGTQPRFVIREKRAVPVIGEGVLTRTELYLAAIDLMIKLEDRKTFNLMYGTGKNNLYSKIFTGQVRIKDDSIKIEFKYQRHPDRPRSVIDNNITSLIDDMVGKNTDRLFLQDGELPNYRKRGILNQKFGATHLDKEEMIADLEALGLYKEGASLEGVFSHVSEDESLSRVLSVQAEDNSAGFYVTFTERD